MSKTREPVAFARNQDNFLAIGGGVFAVGAGITRGVADITIVMILTLFFMASPRSMKRTAARFFPHHQREKFNDLVQEVSGAVGRYVIGQLGLALINGILSLIFLTIIGAPLPALLALIAFVGSLIPLVGTLIASIINSLVCLVVSPITALAASVIIIIQKVIFPSQDAKFLSAPRGAERNSP